MNEKKQRPEYILKEYTSVDHLSNLLTHISSLHQATWLYYPYYVKGKTTL